MPTTFQQYAALPFELPSESTSISRNICPLSLPNGDCFVFYTDRMGASKTYDVKVYDVANPSGKVVYKFDETGMTDFPLGSRVLFGGTVVNTLSKETPQMKWISYVSDDTTTPVKVRPIIEAYCPSVQYDPRTNMVNLFFWCNMNVDGTGVDGKGVWSDYTIENIAVYQGLSAGFTTDVGVVSSVKVVKVLYHAQGYFKKVANLNGAISNLEVFDKNGVVVTDPTTITNRTNLAYYLPIFSQPKAINIPKKIGGTAYKADVILDVATQSQSQEREFQIDTLNMTQTTCVIGFKNIWYQRGVALIRKPATTRLFLTLTSGLNVSPVTFSVAAEIDILGDEASMINATGLTASAAKARLEDGFYTKWLYLVTVTNGVWSITEDYRGSAINELG